MNFRIFRIAGFSALGLMALVLLAWQWGLIPTSSRSKGDSIAARVGGPFTLVDQDGKSRSAQEFRGKLMLIYFGYTFCPDVCPTALQVMSNALQMLGRKADGIQPILITLDPARDTPSQLKPYVANFYPTLIGLTGSQEAIKQVANAYRVYFRKAQDGSTTEYLMDHSSIVFLMGRDGIYLTHFTHRTPADRMAQAIRKFL